MGAGSLFVVVCFSCLLATKSHVDEVMLRSGLKSAHQSASVRFSLVCLKLRYVYPQITILGGYTVIGYD